MDENSVLPIKYPTSRTTIDEMCAILNHFKIKAAEYTDCTIVYEVTFDQLRTIYNLGKDNG